MQRSRRSRRSAAASLALAVCLGLVVPGCAPTNGTGKAEAQSHDRTEDRQAVIEAHRALIEAYQEGDTDAFALMLDKTDQLLIYHPRLEDRWDGIDEVYQNLPRMFERLGRSVWLDVHLEVSVEGDVAWLTSHVVIESPGIEPPFTGRGTEVWVRRAPGWKLVHGHWSANPEFESASP